VTITWSLALVETEFIYDTCELVATFATVRLVPEEL
jgi:hypothetical protein